MSQKSVLSGLKIAVLGGGNMGGALIKGMAEKSVYPQKIHVFDIDKKKIDALRKETPINVAKSARACVSLCDILILAVKPQILKEVIEDIATSLPKNALVISIAAGVNMQTIESYFKKPVCLIRVMPNMPALVGEGMSAYSLGKHVMVKHKKMVEVILESVGEAVSVPEKSLDLVTALSGSGPAYFFLLTEKMVEAAFELGMKADVAKKLVYQTLLGSGKIIKETFEDPDVLIGRVASKGGTTEAALKVFQKQGFGKIVEDAVKAAYNRSKELSNPSKEK